MFTTPAKLRVIQACFKTRMSRDGDLLSPLLKFEIMSSCRGFSALFCRACHFNNLLLIRAQYNTLVRSVLDYGSIARNPNEVFFVVEGNTEKIS